MSSALTVIVLSLNLIYVELQVMQKKIIENDFQTFPKKLWTTRAVKKRKKL